MDIGVNVPIIEFRADLAGLRDSFRQRRSWAMPICVFSTIVLGADPQFHPEVPEFPYTHQSYLMNR